MPEMTEGLYKTRRSTERQLWLIAPDGRWLCAFDRTEHDAETAGIIVERLNRALQAEESCADDN